MSLTPRDLRLIFEGSREGIAVVRDGVVADANPALCDLLRYSHKQLASLPEAEHLVREQDREALAALLRAPADFGAQLPPLKIGMLRREGDSIPATLHARRSGDAWFLFVVPLPTDPAADGLLGTGRHTVRERTRDLERSRQRYRQIVEGLADGLVTLNEHSEFLFVNRAFANMLGYGARSQLVAQSFMQILDPDDRKRIARALARWRAGEVTRTEATLVGAHGRAVPVLLSGTVMNQSVPPGPPRVLLLVTDFAERQALSERLALARKMEGLSSLAGGIAHDFNNLLTGILGNASRIRITTSEPNIDELARAVEDSAELAARLTQRLLALVRGQAPDRRLLDVVDLVQHTVGLLGRVLPESISLQTEFEAGLPPVLADESQLQQAVLNLCINARDAMTEHSGGGLLHISARSGKLSKPLDDGTMTEEDAVELIVSDTGPGVPPEVRARIFDPFFTTKGLGRGIGLGLATVYQLVDAHGGTVEVSDTPGGGATFRLRLPMHRGSRVGEPATRPSQTSVDEEAAPQKGTILLAEDEPAVRMLVSSALQAQGYEVLAGEDGPSALEHWNQHAHRIDLLFLDVRMPGLDGPEVLRIARQTRPRIPAVFSSGFIPDDPASQEVFDRVLYLPKPYRVPDLITVVSEALRRLGDGETGSHTPLGVVTTLDEDVVGPISAGYGGAGQVVDASQTLVNERPIDTTEFGVD